MLTTAQRAALAADITADPAFAPLPHNSDGALAIAAAYAVTASPDFWVWRTSVSKSEVTQSASVDGTTFSWPQLIARTASEQFGWQELFSGGEVNAALPNTRQAFSDIFSGAQAAPTAQRAHLLATARRKANRAEKLFATGTGSTASPATMGFEGELVYQDVMVAMGW